MRVIGYIRVSTEEQAHNGQSLDAYVVTLKLISIIGDVR
jgi:DNA invertase Pin-like site-specific DNA recombinase